MKKHQVKPWNGRAEYWTPDHQVKFMGLVEGVQPDGDGGLYAYLLVDGIQSSPDLVFDSYYCDIAGREVRLGSAIRVPLPILRVNAVHLVRNEDQGD